MSKVLIIAAHPDDEILGIGATVRKRILQGDTVRAIILGEGQTSRWENRKEVPKEILEELHNDTLKAASYIGYEKIYFANFPDNRFDHVDLLDVVKYIENIVKDFYPDIVYTHHSGDLNIDHQITYKATLTATRPVGQFSVKEVYAFETLSSTEWNFSCVNPFRPNIFEDVSSTFLDKVEAMKCYKSELCKFPHPRSIEAMEILAKKYGSIIGRTYAEAFMVIRIIN